MPPSPLCIPYSPLAGYTLIRLHLCTHPQGLGKTVEVIALLLAHKDDPALRGQPVPCPPASDGEP